MSLLAGLIPKEDYLLGELENFSLPEVCNRVKALMDTDEASMEDIAQVIFVEPTIVSRLIKMANSSLFNLRRPISTLSDALKVLGMDTTYRLLVTDFSCTLFKQLHNDTIDMRRFWQQSFASAISCYQLARENFNLNKRQAESLYIAGLLHNIGELLVAQRNPRLAALISHATNKDKHPFDAQRSLCGFSYPELSALALKSWGFPEEMSNSIAGLNCNSLDVEAPLNERILTIGIHCGIVASMEEHYSAESFFSDEGNFQDIPELGSIEGIKRTLREVSDMSNSAIRSMDEIRINSI